MYKYFPSMVGFLLIIYFYNVYDVTDTTKSYYYLQPNFLDTPSNLTVLIVLLIAVHVISNYIYIYSNWESEKCKPGNFFLAPLFFKDTKQTIKDCMGSILEKNVTRNFENIANKVSGFETNITNLSNDVDNLSNEANGFSDSTSSRLASATNSLRESVEYAKNSMSTILGALFINSQMSNDTLNVVSDIDKTTVSNIINDFNEVELP
mgnify:FL=1